MGRARQKRRDQARLALLEYEIVVLREPEAGHLIHEPEAAAFDLAHDIVLAQTHVVERALRRHAGDALEIENDEAAAGLERLAYRSEYRRDLLEVVVDVAREHEVDAVFGELGVGLRAGTRRDVRKAFTRRTLADRVEERRRDIDRDDLTARCDAAREHHREKPGARADVRNRH